MTSSIGKVERDNMTSRMKQNDVQIEEYDI